jgi:hypothetical protein
VACELHLPPNRSLASNTTGSNPKDASSRAQLKPAIPAPTTATLGEAPRASATLMRSILSAFITVFVLECHRELERLIHVELQISGDAC